MTRLVSLWLPRWSTDRLCRPATPLHTDKALPLDTPLVLKGSDGRRRVVYALNATAEALGIRRHMPLARAQVLVEGLKVLDSDPVADSVALERLAQWALRRYSPMVAVDPPDGLIMEITGAAHLHGGEQALLEGLVAALKDKGVEARAAIADSWGAAHAVARHSRKPTRIIPVGHIFAAVERLPVDALRLSSSVAQSLYGLGFETISDLATQPRAPLARRFGLETLRRLDQMMGREPEPFEPVAIPDVVSVERGFFEPIGAPETLTRYTGQLAQKLCEALQARNQGVLQVDLLFTRVDNRIEAIRVGMARPMREAKRLTRLLCDKLETLDPGFGVERMRLIASETEILLPVQIDTQNSTAVDYGGLIDILANRNGDANIYRATPVTSDVPERSVVRRPALDDTVGNWPRTSWPRPVRLLRRPEPLKPLTRLPDHPPSHLIWQNQRYRVTAADGPERIFGEWWRRDAETHLVRDYFRLELETGERLWVFRSGDGERPETGSQQWYLHGVFG